MKPTLEYYESMLNRIHRLSLDLSAHPEPEEYNRDFEQVKADVGWSSHYYRVFLGTLGYESIWHPEKRKWTLRKL